MAISVLLGAAAGAVALASARHNSVADSDSGVAAKDRQRLRRLIQDGTLPHPQEGLNFVDLAAALALCCGLAPEKLTREAKAQELALELGGTARQHIVLVLCDGMGCNILAQHLAADSFLRTHNDPDRLRAVFPATTPAALTSLATGAWPGQHGAPGWDLRDQKGCEYPGQPVDGGVVQLRVLHNRVTDMRTNRPTSEFGFTDEDVYVSKAWADLGKSIRRHAYINAYNGTAFTEFYQGKTNANDLTTIQETALETIGTPEGSAVALKAFAAGVDATLKAVTSAEQHMAKSYTYFYTAHPDKHCHALGTEHPEVNAVVRGFDTELARLWSGLKDKDVAMVVTADHGHVTVEPSQMVALPEDLVECLEYANVGVLGKGRHGTLHVRAGRQREFQERWARHPRLCSDFLLLTVEDAVAEGIFGPDPIKSVVRPRLGDFLAVSLHRDTLVTPGEAAMFRDCAHPTCKGAHGALTWEELCIPFVLLRP